MHHPGLSPRHRRNATKEILSSRVRRDLDRTKIGPMPDFGRGVVVLNRHCSRLVISLVSKFWNITADHSYFKIMGTSKTKQPQEIYHAGWLYILWALSELFAGAKFVDSRISTKLEKYMTWGALSHSFCSLKTICQRQIDRLSNNHQDWRSILRGAGGWLYIHFVWLLANIILPAPDANKKFPGRRQTDTTAFSNTPSINGRDKATLSWRI